jgi:outer membrane receptor protein involved in Fe transport
MEIDQSRMTTRGITQAVLVISAIALFGSGAQPALAQSGEGLEVDSEAPAQPAPSPSGARSTSSKPADAPAPAPTEYRTDVPSPGAEVRIVVAGESEAAAAYAAGDSVTGFNAADIEALGALSVADLAGFTPNLEITTAGATTPTFFIRGVGLNDFNSNASGAVAIFQDDVAINAPAMQLGTLFDVENIGVLRGPVGYGPARNASAGAIRVYSRKPTGSYNGYLRSTYGNYNYNDFEGAVEAPVYEDVLLARFAFRTSHRDGYQRNACGGIPAYPNGPRRTAGQRPTDPRWSICGEEVPRRNFPLAAGTKVNGIPQPEPFLANGFTLNPLNAPTYVNNLGNWASRLTLRFQPTLDQDWLINGHYGNRDEYTRQGISYGTNGVQRFPDGSQISGVLGGPDGAGFFVRPQVAAMREQTNALLRALGLGQSEALDSRNILVANQIGPNLDYEPYTGYYNNVGPTTNEVYGGYVRGEINFLEGLKLTTISAYDAYDRFIEGDTDQSPNTLFHIVTDDEGWQFYQQLGVEGAYEEHGIDWEVGGFFLQESLTVAINNDFGFLGNVGITDRFYVQDTSSYGLYTDFEWEFWDSFTLEGGVRYNWESKSIDYELINTNQTITAFNEKKRSAPTGGVRLTYNFRDDSHVYWKYTRGWKGGHFNASSPLNPEDGVTYAEPETNNAYETGMAASWFDSRVRLDTNFFYYDYDNYQLFTVQNSADATPEFVVINAAGVQVYGAEVDLNTRPFDNTRLQARFSWLESTFTDFVLKNVIAIQPQGSPFQIRQVRDINLTGNRLTNSPQFKISFTAEQTIPLGRYGSLTARYDTAYTDVTFYDPTEGRGLPNEDDLIFLPPNTIAQKDYWLHNLLFIYRPPVGNFTFEFFVRNVTDEVYKRFAFDATVFQNTTIFFTGEPRMFGGTVSVNF